MPRIDLYVLREFMTPFSILIFAFTLLFLIADVFNDLGDFLDAHSPVYIGMRYFLLKIPGNVRFILPLTVLLSCMYTLANFGRHRELTAMRASGISLIRSCFSIYVISFLVMLLNYWFNEALIPRCAQEADLLITLATKGEAYVNEKTEKLQFHSPDKMRSWFIGQFDSRGVQKDVKIKFFMPDEDGRSKIPVRVLTAKEGRYEAGTGWLFDQYEITEYLSGLPSKTIRQKPDDGPFVLSKDDVAEYPEMIEKTIILPENLTTRDLYAILKHNRSMAPNLRNQYESLLYNRLVFPMVCFLCSFLALPLASKNERAGIFTAIVTAVAVVVAYQILTQLTMIAGKNGYMPPWLAGTFPTIALIGYGWFFLIRKSG